jgi:Ca-activated chloride channel family protein
VTRQLVLALALPPAFLVPCLQAFQQPSFRSNTLGVRVDVLVTEGRRPVRGLTAADFDLRDNGVPQAIELVDATDVPLNVVLALDTSGSTTGTRQADLIAASQALLAGLKPADRAALTTFSHAVEPAMALTNDLAGVRRALQQITPSGRTSIMDAVYVALTATLAQPGRSLVVVCTDGADISSWLRPGDVVESAKRSNAVIYAVTSADALRVASLEELTDATGGDTFRVSSSADLRGAFEKVLQEFRSRYILAYTPTGVPTGGFHRLDVRVKRRGLSVKARPGYIGVEPSR